MYEERTLRITLASTLRRPRCGIPMSIDSTPNSTCPKYAYEETGQEYAYEETGQGT